MNSSKKIISTKALSLLLFIAVLLSMIQDAGISAFAKSNGNKYKNSNLDSRAVLYLDDGDIVFDSGKVSVGGNSITPNENGYIITQKDSGAAAIKDKTVSVKGGMQNITLKNINIDVSHTGNACAFLIANNASVRLTLDGENYLSSGENCAALQTQADSDDLLDASLTVTAESTGSLTAVGGDKSAGIGGGSCGNGGVIEIDGGTVTANGGNRGAGIGGGGYSFDDSGDPGTGGIITVNGGTVTANGGYGGAGIGGGAGCDGGIITISGGKVTAAGRGVGAGIGGGINVDADSRRKLCSGGTITISGGTVHAAGGEVGAGIGGGTYDAVGTIEISGGMVTAVGGYLDTGIDGGTINIGGGVVTATGGKNCMGIGANYAENGMINISGGIVMATGGENGAGIGTNYISSHKGSNVTVTISDGVVTADGGKYGAGIGGGYLCNGCTVNISGGTVTANGGDHGAGIGGGFNDNWNTSTYGKGGNVTISGKNTQVIAKGQNGGYDIGSGSGCSVGGSLAVSDGATVNMESSSGNTNASTITYNDCKIISGNTSKTESVYNSSGRRFLATPNVITAALTMEPVSGGEWKLTAKAAKDGFSVEKGNFTFEYNKSAAENGAIAENIAVDSDTGEASCIWENPITDGQAAITVKYRDTTNSYDALKVVYYFLPIAINLSTINSGGFGFSYSGETVAITHDGCYMFTGRTTKNRLALPSGVSACVTLQNAAIDVSGTSGACAFSIAEGTAVNLALEGINTLKSGENCAGLQVQESTDDSILDALLNLTDESNGSLTVVGGTKGAGIGGKNGSAGGTITINGGTIEANGGYGGAGIGGGEGSAGGIVTVSGGTVTANGGYGSAGIGGGEGSAGGIVTVNGGTIMANGGDYGAGIGGGKGSTGGTITISGGTVEANGGNCSAGIGGGTGGNGGIITISGGTVAANGGDHGAGIGGGEGGAGGRITIRDSMIMSTGGIGGAGIGGGYDGAGGVIVIISGEHSKVTAKGQGGGCDIGSGASSGKGPSKSRDSNSNSKSGSSASEKPVNVVNLETVTTSILNSEARIQLEIGAEAVLVAAKGATALEPYQMTIAVPTSDLVKQIANADVARVSLDVTLPSAITSNANIDIGSIIVDSMVLTAAKTAGKDISVAVIDGTGRQIYTITLYGTTMKNSAVSTDAMNFAASVKNITGGKEILMKHSGFVSGGAANVELFDFTPNSLQYVYSVDSVTGMYVPVATVQADAFGNVNLPVPAGGKYLVLSDPAANAFPVKCDTLFPATLKKGAVYTYRITATSNEYPTITTGNSSFFGKVTKRSGNDIYFTITANGKSGDATGIYCTMPGGKAVRIAAAAIK